MSWKSNIVKPFAKQTARRIEKLSQSSVECQRNVFKKLIDGGKNTIFGHDHHFSSIKTHADFIKNVPIRDYEALKTYIDRIKQGETNILWRGKPAYFAKTSGTTSGVKYIPITKDSLPNHFGSARNALFNFSAKTGNFDWLDGKQIFLSGSPELENRGGIPTGRLSGISNHLVPSWLRSSQMPSFKTNCIDDWEKKLDAIVRETVSEKMTLISGIPPWVQMYYERLLDFTGKKTILDIFPHYSVFVYGGVNFEPYRAKLESLVGGAINSVEVFPASEGFIAFQDEPGEKSLWLNVDSGIFYEFVPTSEIFKEKPMRLSLEDVQIGVNYALIINNNAGLWGYNIGDTVMFTSKNPYRLLVTGRIKHFISAFGEHVIGKEVETALLSVAKKENLRIIEFHVAPQVNPPEKGLPYHEWFIEFDEMPHFLGELAEKVDKAMTKENIYYDDLIKSGILQQLIIRPVKRDTFRNYMKKQGKLGGQNKVPRLSNDRKIADALVPHIIYPQ